LVIDDYAHHPTELSAALRAARSMFGERRLVAAFQPHLYSRTRDFAREFGTALALADVVWLTDVFPARESPIPGITGRTVVEAAEGAGATEVHYVEEVDRLAEEMAGRLRAGDVVLTLGAGSIESLGPRLVAALQEPAHA
jgi:UDP-N-acetylmuramate--alanine ligase